MTVWPTVQLREVADIAAGITLGRKTNETALIDVPYMRVANVKDGVLDISDMKTVAATAREIEKWTLRDGDLLLTEGGDLDKLGRGACWRDQLPLCIHQNHIFRVRLPGDRYDPDFVSYQVGSPYGKAYFFAHAKKTTGIASINQGVLGAFPLLSPPIAEQRRIAVRLKAQLAEVEIARQAIQLRVRDANALYAAFLQGAFDDLPGKRVMLSEVARIDARLVNPTDTEFSQLPHVSAENITPVTGKLQNIRSAAEDGMESGKYLFDAGDVLYSKLRPYLRKVAIAGFNGLCSADMYPLKFDPEIIDDEFLRGLLASSDFTAYAVEMSARSRMPKLNREQLFGYEFSLPNIADQRRIVTRLKAQLTEADAIAQAAAAQLAEIEKLPQQLLARAFHTTPGGNP